jgi:hypothetical protein
MTTVVQCSTIRYWKNKRAFPCSFFACFDSERDSTVDQDVEEVSD